MLQGYKPIEIGDKGTFDGFFKRQPPEISEYTFTNLYMWRNYYQFSWKVVDGCLILLSLKDPSKTIIFPPVGENITSVMAPLYAELKKEGKHVECHRVPETMVPGIKQSGLNIDVVDDRGNWDYVYRTRDLSSLEGPKYADSRKKLSRFNRDHDVEFKKLDAATVGKCLEMQEEWCDLKACKESPGLSVENDAIEDAFEHWKELGFSGCVMVEKDRIIGYALGEWLNPRTMVCHVEKANPRPSHFGAYQAINKSFAENCSRGFEFINREQDVGEPGLRRAKESYNPDHMVKKFKILVK
jgi:hypothetical protein